MSDRLGDREPGEVTVGLLRRPQRAGKMSLWRELPLLVLLAVIVALGIKTFAVQAFYIEGSSMYPTLETSDRVLVEKISSYFGPPHRGDVVVLETGFLARHLPHQPSPSLLARVESTYRELVGLPSAGSEDYIKRVVAEGGDRVSARGGALYLDGRRVAEPYLPPRTRTGSFGPVIVPEGDVFVLGDNRAGSMDSRAFGAVPLDAVVGRALTVIWPLGHIHALRS